MSIFLYFYIVITYYLNRNFLIFNKKMLLLTIELTGV